MQFVGCRRLSSFQASIFHDDAKLKLLNSTWMSSSSRFGPHRCCYCDTSSSESSLQSNSQPTASRIQLKVENPYIVTLHSHIIVLSDALQLFHGFSNPHTLHTQTKLFFTASWERECIRESYVNFPATKRLKILIKCRVENYLFCSYVVLVGRERVESG